MKRNRPATLEPFSATLVFVVVLHAALALGGRWLWQEHATTFNGTRKAALAWKSPADFKGMPSKHSPPPVKMAAPPLATAPKPKKVTPVPAEEPAPKAMLVAAPPDQEQLDPGLNAPDTPLFAPVTSPPKPSANRSITLRRIRDKVAMPSNAIGKPAPPIASPTLLDIAKLNRMRPPPASLSMEIIKKGIPEDDAALDGVDEAVNAAFLSAWTAPPIAEVPPAQREARLNVSVGPDGTIVRAQMMKFSGSHVLDQSILEAAALVKKISATLPSNFAKESYDLELNFLLLP